MVSRSLLALFAIALIAAAVNAAPAEDIDSQIDEDLERFHLPKSVKEAGKALAKKALEYLKEKASRVNWGCVSEVLDACDMNPVFHPQRFGRCAKNYIVEHVDHCYHKAE